MEFEFFKQFTDEDYFSDPLVFGLLSAMKRLEGESIIRIGGPHVWDQKQHLEYSGAAGFKFSSKKDGSFKPEKLAKMALFDLSTGASEMIAFPAPGKSLAQSPAPATSEEVLFQKVIRLPAARFNGPWGRWRLFVYAGGVMSNPIDFETGHRELTEKDRQIPPHLLRAPTEQELSSQVFAQRPASPQLNAPGIAFLQEAGETSVDARRWMYPLDLTLFVADDFPPQQHWIPVRLLFGSDVNWANHSIEILIPKERMTKVEGGLVGHYSLDLAPLLIDSSTGMPVQPKEWYLTAICKGVSAGPQALTAPVR